MTDADIGHSIASLCGWIATIAFTIQYFPQTFLNYRRKSVKGFSVTGILIKHIGACFLAVNSFIVGERFSVVFYGFFNVLQHSIFLVQFTMYVRASDEDADRATSAAVAPPRPLSVWARDVLLAVLGLATRSPHDGRDLSSLVYLRWLFFPIIPLVLGSVWPWSMGLTNLVKPLAQVFSHFPQLMLCHRVRTTRGVSLLTQHLNTIGGVAGLIMCYIIPPVSLSIWFMYLNSMFQAFTIYLLAFWHDGWPVRARDARKSLPVMSPSASDALPRRV